jgi:hypothetical protein
MRTTLRILGVLGGAMVIYVLGIGPVLRVTQEHYRMRRVSELAYAPLLHGGAASGMLDSYLEFWGVSFMIRDVTPLPARK